MALVALVSAATPAQAGHGVDRAGRYLYLDSADAHGPAYDPEPVDTQLVVADPQDGEVDLTLPFAFSLHDVTHTTVTVGVNGALAFPAGLGVAPVNPDLEGGSGAPTIAPWWDDWQLGDGALETGLSGTAPDRTFTIQWTDVEPAVVGGSEVTFQVQLRERGSTIGFHYLDTSTDVVPPGDGEPDGGSGTVGVSDGGTAKVLQFSVNDPAIEDTFAIRFTPVMCQGFRATRLGTFGGDTITGGAGPNVIATLDGHDVVHAKRDNDRVCAGRGDDSVWAGQGNDVVRGDSGDDTLYGGDGGDWLEGGNGADYCNGGRDIDAGFSCLIRVSIP